MICKQCLLFDRCVNPEGQTRYYGSSVAADNVQDLCKFFLHNQEYRKFKAGFWTITIRNNAVRYDCPFCGAIGDGSNFCSHCGSSLEGGYSLYAVYADNRNSN